MLNNSYQQRLIFSLDEYFAYGKERPNEPDKNDPYHKSDEHPIREPEQPQSEDAEIINHLISFLI